MRVIITVILFLSLQTAYANYSQPSSTSPDTLSNFHDDSLAVRNNSDESLNQNCPSVLINENLNLNDVPFCIEHCSDNWDQPQIPADYEQIHSDMEFALRNEELFSFYKSKNLTLCKDEDNLQLYSLLKKWHRTPYRWAGRSRKGVDCQGFVAVMHDSMYNYKLPGGAGSQFNVCDRVPKENLQAGDLVFFKIGGYGISHVGMYLKNNKFIHASSGGYGVIISDLNEHYYKRWYFAGGRVNKDKLRGI